MNDDIKLITVEQAIALLDGDEYVHTFRQAGFALLGADWGRAVLIDAMKAAEPDTLQLTGPAASAMGHGLCFADKHGYVFVATKKAMEG